MHVVFFTLEETYLQALERAATLATNSSGLPFTVAAYPVTRLARAETQAAAAADLACADAVFASMIFFDEQVALVADLLRVTQGARPDLPVVVVTSAPELMKYTHLGSLRLDAGWTRRLLARAESRRTPREEPPAPTGSAPERSAGPALGRQLLGLTRALPRLLRRLPGAPADLARYLLLMQYWVHGTPDNLAGLLLTLAAHYGPPTACQALAGRAI